MNTRITELLKIKYPIIQDRMAWIAESTTITETTFNKAKKVVVGYMNFSQQ